MAKILVSIERANTDHEFHLVVSVYGSGPTTHQGERRNFDVEVTSGSEADLHKDLLDAVVSELTSYYTFTPVLSDITFVNLPVKLA